ncbi:MAG: peptide deformylase [Candidatus Susulua stagnicola]|nr:peptide deformylase [Candidatus Susulua stagnicola]
MNKTKLKIHTWPEDILRNRCKKIDKVDEKIKYLLDEMLCLMRISGGAGLAGNQAGLDLSLIVIEIENRVFKLINPEIIKREGSVSFAEGCLSFPGLELEPKRNKKVWVSALDQEGKPVKIEAEGFLAVAFQHEIDHIKGITFINRVSFWSRVKAYPKLRKIIQKTKDELRK